MITQFSPPGSPGTLWYQLSHLRSKKGTPLAGA